MNINLKYMRKFTGNQSILDKPKIRKQSQWQSQLQ